MTLEDTIRSAVRDEVRAAVREALDAIRASVAQPSAPDLMTIAQAAAYASCGPTKINDWLRTRRLNRHGEGRRHVRINKAELDRLLAPKLNAGAPSEADMDRRAEELARGRR